MYTSWSARSHTRRGSWGHLLPTSFGRSWRSSTPSPRRYRATTSCSAWSARSGVYARGWMTRSRGRGLSGARPRTGRAGRRPVADATATYCFWRVARERHVCSPLASYHHPQGAVSLTLPPSPPSPRHAFPHHYRWPKRTATRPRANWAPPHFPRARMEDPWIVWLAVTRLPVLGELVGPLLALPRSYMPTQAWSQLCDVLPPTRVICEVLPPNRAMPNNLGI